jgi:hypothetical protein
MRSVYLGQYTDEIANLIVTELEEAEIGWSYKQASFLTRTFFLGEWGTRLFVDVDRLDDARRIAESIAVRMKPTEQS